MEQLMKFWQWEVSVPNLKLLTGMLLILKRNNIEAIIAGMTDAKSRTGKGKPVCVLLHTEMGNGVDFMMYSHAWHGKHLMHNLKTH
jgi:transketolase